jgi:hypothetical protein
MAEWVEIARVQGPVEAEVVRALLESYDIGVGLRRSLDHALWPFTAHGPGDVRVLVAEGQAEAASELLSQHRHAGLFAIPGGRGPEDEEARRHRPGPAPPPG